MTTPALSLFAVVSMASASIAQVSGVGPAAQQPARDAVSATAVVACRVPDDPRARVFELRKAGDRWQLAFRSVETKDAWIVLALPGARPAIAGGAAQLTYRNANGGRQIDLDVSPGRTTLDVWVDYGLDVNIEPDLDPRVDLMNTEGPLAAVACTVRADR